MPSTCATCCSVRFWPSWSQSTRCSSSPRSAIARLIVCQRSSGTRSALERRARRRAREARLQAQDRLRVQLRDARLRHAEHLADLAQRQLLVVVERDDELLALGQARDRLAERLLQFGLRERALGVRALRVLDR